jgi:hypothetical protein
VVDAQANTYWRYPYRPVLSSRQLVDFVVLDVEPVSSSQAASQNSRFLLADVQVRSFSLPYFAIHLAYDIKKTISPPAHH